MKPPKPPPSLLLFETHITVSSSTNLDLFRITCAELNVKAIAITLPAGDARLQPMTSSFQRGPLADVVSQAAVLASKLARRGFEVVRTKIEQHGRLSDVVLTPTSYFEFHAKLELPSATDPLIDAIGAAGGSLSSNAANPNPLERFLTLRAFGLERPAADARFDALLRAIAARNVPIRNRVRELTVADSNPALDRGWLEAR